MRESIAAMDKGGEGKRERKGKSVLKGEAGKERVFGMHTLEQHRYFTLFEESTDKLLDEYIRLIGDEGKPEPAATMLPTVPTTATMSAAATTGGKPIVNLTQ